ncbi:hypothetical protein [Streptosporangium sp. NPDC002524]|uniref:hypothetical protein n=1 Tax=Streptosporangium sp. NPDC002524 TaxID=3154537 RepID=UPI00332302BA
MRKPSSRTVRYLMLAIALVVSVIAPTSMAYADAKPPTPPLVAPVDPPAPAPAESSGANVAAVECCGLVVRYNSIQNLVIAKDIRNTNAGYGSNCDIWNWNGGNQTSWVTVDRNCRTTSMNGHTYSYNAGYSDTDAFTLQYEPYWLSMHGTWHRIGANVYTKINGLETAKCYRESDGVNCYVVY